MVSTQSKLSVGFMTIILLTVGATNSNLAFGIVNCNGMPATIEGTNGDDVLTGTSGDDVIAGLSGNDIINGMGGNDTICGGSGDDTITAGDGNNYIEGNEGSDIITSGSGNDEIYGGNADDTINVDDGNNYVKGESGVDTITTGSGNDEIYGGNGNDTIDAGDGNNYVKGESGIDTITTGSGNDEIYGGNGDDTIDAGDGNNYVEGNSGIDIITTGSGNDDIYGGNGDDVIVAGDGDNHVHGDNGADSITTGSGDDDIDGHNGDDCINSGSGSDSIDGGAGTNIINDGLCRGATDQSPPIIKDDESEKQRIIHEQKEETKKNIKKQELKQKRDALKVLKKSVLSEIKDLKEDFSQKEIKLLKKEFKQDFKELKNTLTNKDFEEKLEEIEDAAKELLLELQKDPEIDKELKREIKTELKEKIQEETNEMSVSEKSTKNKVDTRISSLSKSSDPANDAKKMGLQYKNGLTKVAIQTTDLDPQLLKQIKSIGKIDAQSKNQIQVTVDIKDLPTIRSISGIDKIRPTYPAVQFEESVSEGVYFVNADLVQFAGITGKGVKVAVLDLAFDTTNEKIADNLVEVKSFRQGFKYPIAAEGIWYENEHGTAIAEIITDVAPNVELYLYTMSTDVEFAAAIDEAISKQVDVIAMAAGWPNFPTDGQSTITEKVEQAIQNDIVFVLPSGNFANKHWEGQFADSNLNNWHEFSNTDEGLSIAVTETRVSEEKPIIAHLMWDVGMTDVADFDLVLVDPLGQIVDYSANKQETKSSSAFEYIHHIPQTDGTYALGIIYAGDMTAPDNRPSATLEVFTVNDQIEYAVPYSSVSVPVDAEGAIVVGAVNHLDGTLEPFSSQGPTNNGKLAPHVVGPDGVTTLALGDDPFFGTSATTPYVAGIAALILETNPEISPAELLSEIQENANSNESILENGFDNTFGYGVADASFLLQNTEVGQ